jgi:hypothetical protein
MITSVGKLAFNGVMQVAYIVPDLKKAMAEYAANLKIGPWFVSEHFVGTEKLYRGTPSDVDMTIAMTYANQMNIELIQQLNDVPSVYRDVSDKRGFGFHHWGVATYDFDRAVADYRSRGYDVAFSTMLRGARLTYFDTTSHLPGMVELIEMNAQREEMFQNMYAAAVTWDGKDPVRPRR